MPHLMEGLTQEAASRICMDQCRAMCCRGPLVLRLEPDEVRGFERRAHDLDVDLVLGRAADGGGLVRFTDHTGESCPMLDRATFACRIYEHRPQRCREFPDRLTPGCAISGG